MYLSIIKYVRYILQAFLSNIIIDNMYIYIFFFTESLEYRIEHYKKKGKLKLECKEK